MTIGIILIVSILFLGGLLATLGDRLGTKVGKARLSLFNLRPRQTAVLVTIVTGTLISGSTLGILFAMSQPLRRGIFEYDETQRKLRQARRELQATQTQKAQIEIDLSRTRAERELVEQNLENLNASLQTVITQKLATEDNLKKTQAQLKEVQNNFEQTQGQLREIQDNFEQTQGQLQEIMGKFQLAQDQLQKVTVQTENLRSELEQLREEREELIRQRDEVRSQIAQRDAEIADRNELIAQRDREIENQNREIENQNQEIENQNQEIENQNQEIEKQTQDIEDRNQVIEEREARLKELEKQQKFLERQVRIFEQYYQDYQDLRQGNLALLRGQIMASAVVEVLEDQGSVQAVNRLLEIANQFAREQVKPGTGELNEQVIQVTPEQVERLQEQIVDGQEYVVRLLSAGNYIRGESNVEIFADVALNQVVFAAGEVIATGITNGVTMSEEELIEQIGILIESCRFRARRGGILESRLQVGDGSPETLMDFVQKIQENPTQITIQAIASETTYTAGPLRIDLVAFADNEEVFRTSLPASP